VALARTEADLARLIEASGVTATQVSERSLSASLVELAIAEGLAPLLGSRVLSGALVVEGAELRRRLVLAQRECLASNLLREQDVRPVLRALVQRDLPVLLLKGAALLRTLYADPGQRPMLDVDLLVPKARFAEALRVARACGARLLGSAERPFTLSRYHERALLLPGGTSVDLHRDLAAWPLFSVPIPGLFARARRDSDGAHVPERIDLFVSLALHVAQDGFVLPLRAVVDALEMIKAWDLDPWGVAARARTWHARKATALWLWVLCRLGGLPAPWGRAARALWPEAPLRVWADDIPHRFEGGDELVRQKANWKMARALDSPWRVLGFVSARSSLYVGDRAVRLGVATRHATRDLRNALTKWG
jgi:hypothetical protein